MGTIDEVKQKLDIIDIASQYTKLQKSGRNFRGLCPFHQEKTASFYVFPDRQSWHCFGACGTGGDVFSLVMRAESLEFGEALTRLAQRTGVTMERGGRKEDAERDRWRVANSTAANYYHQFLLEAREAQPARDYLARRGLDEKTIADFQLGYAPPTGNSLLQNLLQLGFAEAEVLSAGLATKGERGAGHDRFRGRVIFPIKDAQGRVAGFGARALGEELPKYLNTPQTALFDKGNLLYGLDRARSAAQKEDMAVIVEGYTDVLMAHQHGFTNVVASMGTALTERQLKLLQRYTKNLTLALDADAAGSQATLRGIELARSQAQRRSLPVPHWLASGTVLAADIQVFALPEGKDPDQLIRQDPQAWAELVKQARPWLEHLFQAALGGLDLSRARNREQAARQLLPLLAEVADPVQRELYFQRLARQLGIGERTLQGLAAQIETEKKRPSRPASGSGQRRSPQGEPSPIVSLRDRLEELTLALLIRHPELRPQAAGMAVDHFVATENRVLFAAWKDVEGPSLMEANLDDWLREHLEGIMARAPDTQGRAEAVLVDCQRRLEERRLRGLKTEEAHLIASAEASGDTGQLARHAFDLWQKGELPSSADETSQAELRRQGIEISTSLYQVLQKGSLPLQPPPDEAEGDEL